MFRIFVLTFTVLVSTATLAQTAYDPKVAYTQVAGSTIYVVLANDDGSHAVRLTAGVRNINGLDLSPSGKQIAFSDSQGLKVVSFTASDAGIRKDAEQLLVSNALYGGSAYAPDFSFDGGRLVYLTSANTSPNTIRAVTFPGGVQVMAYACYLCDAPRWLRPTSAGERFVYSRRPNSATQEIWTALINADGSVTAGIALTTASQPFVGIEDFDVARTRNALLITANYPTTIRIVDFDLATGALTQKAGFGFRVHYSADDARIIFRDLQVWVLLNT